MGDIPIVHRILKVHEDSDGKVELLTKGDNNRVDDRGLYAPGQLWLEREDILGKAVGTLRYVGMVTIALNDYPVLKYVLVGMMGLFVLTSKEGWLPGPTAKKSVLTMASIGDSLDRYLLVDPLSF